MVRGWLDAGQPEVAVAVADVQIAGRGRLGRTWQAPPGVALLLSVGLRPTGLAASRGWRLGAVVALAMIEAAEEVAGLREGMLWLKWPNDLVTLDSGGEPRKVAGVLGETVVDAAGRVANAVVGIGINADWATADFPPDLADGMSSLRETSGGRTIDREALLEDFLARLEPQYRALLEGRFDVGGWSARQLTTGRRVEVEVANERLVGTALGVDPESGALRVDVPSSGTREVGSGEVIRCRVA